MREIVLDTETTGLDPLSDRIIEIGCVELVNHIPSGRQFQVYINPERSMSVEAFRVHGLSDEFLAKQPRFADIAEAFFAFVGDALLIAHNAEFDVAFLNAEFARLARPAIDPFRIVDTLMLARRRHPGGANSLDGLCARYGIDTSQRTLHGALLDALLLAEVYVELLGGRQAALLLDDTADEMGLVLGPLRSAGVRPRPEPRSLQVSDDELAAHAGLLDRLGASPIWRSYSPAVAAE